MNSLNKIVQNVVFLFSRGPLKICTLGGRLLKSRQKPTEEVVQMLILTK